jgi:DNA processing protein
MSKPQACLECLRRARLLGHLAPYIERHAVGLPGRDALRILGLSNEDLAVAAADRVAEQILARVEATSSQQLLESLEAADCWACCCHDPRYPSVLDDAADAPRTLFGKGDPALLGRLSLEGAVTLVGARRASTYGREVARQIGRDLADAGLVVVSGLAFGIDGCAHRGALDTGATVAVLPCGVDTAYPAAHRSLWRKISEKGLVLSELPPSTGPWRWTFSARSRIMAALSGMTVVVEAAERSGSLITADVAADLGRKVGAVPGPVGSRLSAAPNDLLAGGAHVVRGAQDGLDAILGTGAGKAGSAAPQLEESQRAALAALEDGARTVEEIASDAGLCEADAEAALTRLTELGYVERSPIDAFLATGRAPTC